MKKKCLSCLLVLLLLATSLFSFCFVVPRLVFANPDSNTWQVNNDANDMYTFGGTVREDRAYVYTNYLDASSLYSGYRFTGIDIPQGSIISSAYLFLYGYQTEQLDIDCVLYGEDTDDSTVLEGGTLLDDRDITDASVSWSTPNLELYFVSSPDIKTVIQEIISRVGWESGNSLSIITNDIQSSVSSSSVDYAGEPTKAAKLEVTWEEETVFVTFYLNDGGKFYVNAADTANSTSTEYANETVLVLMAVPASSSYIFVSFNWIASSSSSNPHEYTVLGNDTIWLLFDGAGGADEDYTDPGDLAVAIVATLICLPLLIIFLWALTRRR